MQRNFAQQTLWLSAAATSIRKQCLLASQPCLSGTACWILSIVSSALVVPFKTMFLHHWAFLAEAYAFQPSNFPTSAKVCHICLFADPATALFPMIPFDIVSWC